ncbi:DUF4255 domain-containing protein [Rhizobium sp. WYJ-E13]|uniref:DUF4255 domain-containing protein n=1 Tax=Rhizobium sp. WYJ-E13 TaxID=2849093 RepID=UPI001C1EA5F8|nr:DUF4255 domain-containing protein [Rhizobium sp. WYJ-E13]QWW71222.1 DUF4255 domain-containing protein [Rhizobium sp. WYJ-E13]
MSANAIFSVTQALRARLEASLLNLDNGTVFVGPLDDPDAKGASLILFLYRIVPNATLRNHTHQVISSTPGMEVITYENSLPLTLHYLITVGTRDGSSEDPMLRLLGHAMRALNDDPELAGVRVGNEIAQVSIEPLSTEEMSRIWTLFPTANYRTSVGYVVTPVWIDPRDPPVVARRVTEHSLVAGARTEEVRNG